MLTYFLIGQAIGALLADILLASVIGWLFFRKEPPADRAFRSCLAATILACVVYSLSSSTIEQKLFAIATYIAAAPIAFFFARWRYNRKWRDDDEELADTFR